MGKEAHVQALFADGEDHGQLKFEPPKLVFRGTQRRVYEGLALAGVCALGDALVLADGSRFRLGEKAAALWAATILNPKSRLEKLGVKPGHRVGVLNVADDRLVAELIVGGAQLVSNLTRLDLLFLGADNLDELAMLPSLIPALAEKGALWIVSRKGKRPSSASLHI